MDCHSVHPLPHRRRYCGRRCLPHHPGRQRPPTQRTQGTMTETAERLAKMAPILDRIPEQWGKWIPHPGGDAWLLELDAKLAEMHPDYVLFQVKEKFGGLRFYAGVDLNDSVEEKDPRFNELIHEAEEKSYTICELCGQPGETRKLAWVKTFSDRNFAEAPAWQGNKA